MTVEEWKTFLWNKEDKTFCGRTGRAWGEISSFFFIFYAILLSYFLGMVSVFFQSISDREPSLKGKNSFLENPGLSARPLTKTPDESDYTTLVFFTPDIEHKNTKANVKNVKEALEPYQKAFKTQKSPLWKTCGITQNRTVSAGKKSFCFVNVNQFQLKTVCSIENNFGYTAGAPCVLLRLNKIYGWKPEPYTEGTDEMSVDLKSDISNWYSSKGGAATIGDLVWLDCFGMDEGDHHHMGSSIDYFPYRGFPVTHFPYLNQYGYLQPAVFVKFNNMMKNVAIKIHCRIWAKNVEFDSKTWTGGFHFELFYKNPP